MKIQTTIEISGIEFTGIINISSVVENIEDEDIQDFLAGNDNDEVKSWVDYQMSETSKIKASYNNGILIGTYAAGRGLKAELEIDFSSMASKEEIESLDKYSHTEIATELILGSMKIKKIEVAK